MNKIKKLIMDESKYPVLVPLIAIFLSFAIASVVMIITGINPLAALSALLRAITGINLDKAFMAKGFFNARYIGEFLNTAIPITLTGLSVAFAFRTGLFNIGAEGQLLMGSFAAICVGILFKMPTFIHAVVALIAAALFGFLWGIIPGYLKAKFNIHEVVITIMLNYAALHITNYGLKALPGSDTVKTVKVYESAALHSDFLSNITNNSRLHWGILVVALSLVAFWYVIERTSFGYELRAAGYNKHASEYAGMKVNRNIMFSMGIAGAFAGLAGAMIALGTFDYGRILGSFENYGFDGIAVALLGGNTGIGVFFSGLLFGALKAAQPLMQSNGIPLEIAKIISALIVLFVAMRFGFENFLKKKAEQYSKEVE